MKISTPRQLTRLSESLDSRLTTRLYLFLKYYLTPIVLLAGLLALVVFHFRGVLATAQSQQNALQGAISYNQDGLAMRFNANSGDGRPVLTWNNWNLVSYSEWSSLVAVDGVTQELWNSSHGYTVDNARRQIYVAATGSNWQVIEIATLVNAQTVRVSWSAVLRPQPGQPLPANVEIDIRHTQGAWANPTIQGQTFSAQVMQALGRPTSGQPTLGRLQIALSGSGLASQPFSIADLRSAAGPSGLTSWASILVTRYTLNHPPPNVLLPLGTETITFQPNPANSSFSPQATVAP
jgi:hypothetical protein